MNNNTYTRSVRRKNKRKKRAIKIFLTVFFSLAVIAAAVVVAVLIFGDNDTTPVGYVSDEHGEAPETVTDVPETVTDIPEPVVETPEPVIDEPEPVIDEPETITVSLTKEDISKGYLILVNLQYPCVFPDEDKLIDVYTYKSSAYKFRDTGMLLDPVAAEKLDEMLRAFNEKTGNGDVNIISTYRDLATQQRIYDSKIEYYGSVEKASKWVAYPGTSEHHTGLAVDLGIYTDDGESLDYTGENEYSFINETCPEYGYIVRYDAAKTDITGIAYEPWHFRYLGVPHAEMVSSMGLCYEEYIGYLKAFPQDGTHLFHTDKNGLKYEIFYVPSAGQTTEVSLPKDSVYTVSGNNVDGFIFTVTLK